MSCGAVLVLVATVVLVLVMRLVVGPASSSLVVEDLLMLVLEVLVVANMIRMVFRRR